MKTDTSDIISYLNEKWQGTSCPYCRESEWNIQDRIFELREFNKGDMFLGGPNASIIPVIPVMCSNCGHTVLVNAMVAGVLGEK